MMNNAAAAIRPTTKTTRSALLTQLVQYRTKPSQLTESAIKLEQQTAVGGAARLAGVATKKKAMRNSRASGIENRNRVAFMVPISRLLNPAGGRAGPPAVHLHQCELEEPLLLLPDELPEGPYP